MLSKLQVLWTSRNFAQTLRKLRLLCWNINVTLRTKRIYFLRHFETAMASLSEIKFHMVISGKIYKYKTKFV